MSTAVVLTIVAALAGGLVAGAFLAFSTFVVQGLDRNPAPVAIAAMQGINVTAPHPLFMLALSSGRWSGWPRRWRPSPVTATWPTSGSSSEPEPVSSRR